MTLDTLKNNLNVLVRFVLDQQPPLSLLDILDALNAECEYIRGELIREHETMWEATHGQFKPRKDSE